MAGKHQLDERPEFRYSLRLRPGHPRNDLAQSQLPGKHDQRKSRRRIHGRLPLCLPRRQHTRSAGRLLLGPRRTLHQSRWSVTHAHARHGSLERTRWRLQLYRLGQQMVLPRHRQCSSRRRINHTNHLRQFVRHVQLRPQHRTMGLLGRQL